ncbi:hypothetical protein O181_118062 [Austropuccinia psidii MF-1]|uniref:Uncharacterized protein n=1 Tax=Austropuccinia psidii MF-1 TaxID=1389203 RepID=A0A9Q3Q011_9BASI|nr:hypothetical protein [Austropuccinia psidii MF-1]
MEHGQQNVDNGSIKGRSRNKSAEELSEANGLDRRHKINERIQAHGRARDDFGTPRYGRRSPIFPTTIQQFQALQAKVNFIQRSPIILGSLQKKERTPRKKQNSFQPEEERRRPLDEETDVSSPRDAQKQNRYVPKSGINRLESIDPEPTSENKIHTHHFKNNEPVNNKLT